MSLSTLFRSGNVIKANDHFAFDLYLRHAKERSSTQNIVFSPFSLSCLMAMAYEGARGRTAQQIGDVFHFPADIEELRSGYAKALPRADGHAFIMRVANALWVQYGYGLRSEYVRDMQCHYGGEIAAIDFINDPCAAVGRINRWVGHNTSDKIRDLISIFDVTDLTRLILTNAVYFRSEWHRQFEGVSTEKKVFTTSEGEPRRVAMMRQISHFAYRETLDAQIVKLAYAGKTVSMTLVLPKRNDLSAFEDRLTQKEFREWENGLRGTFVEISLPKFKFGAREKMGQTLKAMGMPAAFSVDYADFSGIAPITSSDYNLYLEDVIHEAVIDVDETGTEAAAASAAIMVEDTMSTWPSLSEPVVFNADHPFLFLIQENPAGTILFMGRVADPGAD